jgi:hypothetical protein
MRGVSGDLQHAIVVEVRDGRVRNKLIYVVIGVTANAERDKGLCGTTATTGISPGRRKAHTRHQAEESGPSAPTPIPQTSRPRNRPTRRDDIFPTSAS